jgi:hypothetical protein
MPFAKYRGQEEKLFHKETVKTGLIENERYSTHGIGQHAEGLLNNRAGDNILTRTGYHWGKDDPLSCLKQPPSFLQGKASCRSVLSITLTETSFLMPEDGT